MSLVFQYGSNTSSARLNSQERLEGAAIPIGLGRTVGKYDLAFTRQSERQGYAVADLIPGRTRVLGVIYEIPDSRIYRNPSLRIRTLDQIEGEGRAYRRTPIEVERLDTGEAAQMLTYLVIERTTGLRTSVDYVRHIITGLREFGAPEDYVRYVKTRATDSIPDARELIEAYEASQL
jgi:cation transport regulator ChaC